jgi:hypothetical protein
MAFTMKKIAAIAMIAAVQPVSAADPAIGEDGHMCKKGTKEAKYKKDDGDDANKGNCYTCDGTSTTEQVKTPTTKKSEVDACKASALLRYGAGFAAMGLSVLALLI